MVNDLYSATDEGSLIIGDGLAYLLQDDLGKRDYLDVGKIHSKYGYDNSYEHISAAIGAHGSAYLAVFREYPAPEDKELANRILRSHKTTQILNKTYASRGIFSERWSKLDLAVYRIEK